ncbi:MAG: hypothetical protein H6973_05445 [Gammaproteobacteria bacterium]|nr:hypothetical protein [Gammaproteobacteria bacterium]
MERFDLQRAIQPFQRCVRCNGRLAATTKQQVWERLPAGRRQSVRDS